MKKTLNGVKLSRKSCRRHSTFRKGSRHSCFCVFLMCCYVFCVLLMCCFRLFTKDLCHSCFHLRIPTLCLFSRIAPFFFVLPLHTFSAFLSIHAFPAACRCPCDVTRFAQLVTSRPFSSVPSHPPPLPPQEFANSCALSCEAFPKYRSLILPLYPARSLTNALARTQERGAMSLHQRGFPGPHTIHTIQGHLHSV